MRPSVEVQRLRRNHNQAPSPAVHPPCFFHPLCCFPQPPSLLIPFSFSSLSTLPAPLPLAHTTTHLHFRFLHSAGQSALPDQLAQVWFRFRGGDAHERPLAALAISGLCDFVAHSHSLLRVLPPLPSPRISHPKPGCFRLFFLPLSHVLSLCLIAHLFARSLALARSLSLCSRTLYPSFLLVLSSPQHRHACRLF